MRELDNWLIELTNIIMQRTNDIGREPASFQIGWLTSARASVHIEGLARTTGTPGDVLQRLVEKVRARCPECEGPLEYADDECRGHCSANCNQRGL